MMNYYGIKWYHCYGNRGAKRNEGLFFDLQKVAERIKIRQGENINLVN